jgi:predicted nucleotidyltransferase
MTLSTALAPIPGLPTEASTALLETLASYPGVNQVWLYGSRAMGRERLGSDIDLSLEGPSLSHADLLQLMDAVDELLLAWKVDLTLRHQLPAELMAHLQRVGLPLLSSEAGSSSPSTPHHKPAS